MISRLMEYGHHPKAFTFTQNIPAHDIFIVYYYNSFLSLLASIAYFVKSDPIIFWLKSLGVFCFLVCSCLCFSFRHLVRHKSAVDLTDDIVCAV